MSIKFGLWINFDLRMSVTSSNVKPEVVSATVATIMKLYMPSLLRRGRPDLYEIW